MYKLNIKRKIILLVLVISVLCYGCQENTEKYSVGKDTIVSVGDGRFQIMKEVDEKVLADLETDNDILRNVIGYYDDEDSKLYVLGTGTYIVVDYKNNSYNIYYSWDKDSIPEEDKKVFLNDKMIRMD